MVENLERNLPNIKQEIDALYYSCYNSPEIVEKPINNKTVHMAKLLGLKKVAVGL